MWCENIVKNMTEATDSPFTNKVALARLKRRRAADARFRWYGISAIALALLALIILLTSIVSRAVEASTTHVIAFSVPLDPAKLAPQGKERPADIARNVEGAFGLLRDELYVRFPGVKEDSAARRAMGGMISRLAALDLARYAAENPQAIGKRVHFNVPISDDLDLYLKGSLSPETRVAVRGIKSAQPIEGTRWRLSGEDAFAPVLAARLVQDDTRSADARRSILLIADTSVARLVNVTPDAAELDVLTGDAAAFTQTDATARLIARPPEERAISDQQIAWALALQAEGRVKRVAHTSLLTKSDSTYPELAGALAAIVGSFFTLLITATLAIPIGVFAAVYLEEFAPKNRVTDLIEVNINNLAAVPSIVFGLLGLAVFLNTFGFPRSAPIAGGMVLALMTFPVVIIAARASLKAVPPSIRSGALAVGASKMQSVFHHVLPLAAPGIFTGAILGLARALGETAPLLLIGMVAFVNEPPATPLDESTVLPVLIYSWSDRAERAWEPMTAAIIILLLVFLILMNAAVVYLRRKFERRW